MNESNNNLNLNEIDGETGIGFAKRNLNVQKEEEQGGVLFKVVKNDNTPENLIYLTDLKNIISKQLPKMPKEYIVRLVLDRKHESMVLIKDKKRVVGGVCYRPNYQEKFIEIAFLAISHTEQVKGYGTRLMNKLKDHCKTQGLQYFLTYADNNAIGYFKKQGFSNYIKTPIEIWKDLIKDYDGGTLMEAYVNKNIDYSNLSVNLQKQKDFLINSVSKYLNIKQVRKHDDLETILSRNRNEIIIEKMEGDEKGEKVTISKKLFNMIPGIKESNWDYENDYLPQLNNLSVLDFVTQCRNIIIKLREEKSSQPFLVPVNKDQVADYYEVIKEPMGKFS